MKYCSCICYLQYPSNHRELVEKTCSTKGYFGFSNCSFNNELEQRLDKKLISHVMSPSF
jgi:hypothetical protein